MSNLEVAIEQAGGIAAMANKLGVTRAAINNWKNRGVPPRRAVQIVALRGVKVKKKELCPEIF